MASRPRDAVSRPRVPHLRRTLGAPTRRTVLPRRTLLPRRAPLTAARGTRLSHGPVDLSTLAVRRPWWFTARRHLLLRQGAAQTYAAVEHPAATLLMAAPPAVDALPAALHPAPLSSGGPRGAPARSRLPLTRRSARPLAARSARRPAAMPPAAAAGSSVDIDRAPAAVVSAGPRMSLVPAVPPLALAAVARRLSVPASGPAGPVPAGQPAAPTTPHSPAVAATGVVPAAFALAPPRPGALASALRARRALPLAAPASDDAGTRTSGTLPAAAGDRPLGTVNGPVGRHTLRTGVPGRRLPRPETVAASQVADLRVLGAAPVAAPAGGFDPGANLSWPGPARTAGLSGPARTAALSGPARTAGGAPARQAGRAAPVPPMTARRATAPRMRPEPAVAPPDPAGRWRAAVAARPLESPRPFPAGLRPLVAALTGAQRASYTTGPATRHALQAAGAHGATTGTVVHLPVAPSPAPGPLLGVVAHELAHARHPVSRPRFLLQSLRGDADSDEREALSIGQRVQSAASGGGDAIRAGIVDELPVGGMGRVAGPVRGALSGGAGAVTDQASAAFGGAAAASSAIGASGLSGAGLGAGGLSGGGLGAGGLDGAADAVLPGAGAPASWPGAGMPGADLASGAGAAGGAAMGGAMAAASNASGPVPGGAQQPSNVDIDRLADLLEQRLLKQIERRGGRYAGVF